MFTEEFVGTLGSDIWDYSGTSAGHVVEPAPGNRGQQVRGEVRYELTDHLGNVRLVIPDRKLPSQNGGAVDFAPDVVTAQDYYPFGMFMPGRQYSNASFTNQEMRFRFQGQEGDDEWLGEGNAYVFKYRVSDSRIGRFFSVDPLAPQYPHNSPYAFSENSTTAFVELEGLEKVSISNVDASINIGLPTVLGNESRSSLNPENSYLEGEEIQVINMEYAIMTNGSGFTDLNFDAFSRAYSRGDISFRSSSRSLGKITNDPDGRYEIMVKYNYSIVSYKNFDDAATWMSQDYVARGVLFAMNGSSKPCIPIQLSDGYGGMKTHNLSTVGIDHYRSIINRRPGFSDDELAMQKAIVGFIYKMTSPALSFGSIGSIGQGGSPNIAIVNVSPKRVDQQLVGAVHETGHNAAFAHAHNSGSYEYHQSGLQNRVDPYPTLQNTLSIINDLVNNNMGYGY